MVAHVLQLLAAQGLVNCGDGTAGCSPGLPVVAASGGQLQRILTIVLASFAAAAVLMIVIAGLRFITAQGNPQEVAKARKTIIYAAVGLVISLSAEIIVGFTIGKL
ncbi:MAG: hypothetical protein JWO41_139 [Candidatus Saccharibacteria bacterium]|nr:hypothetical protein [Candidatus Saccharibacteria bacterium]